MTAARLLLSLMIGTAALTARHAEAASSTTLAESVIGSNYLQVADTRDFSSALPRLETLTLTEASGRNAAAFSAEVFTAAKSGSSADSRPVRQMAGGNLQLDVFLMFAVLLGLVAFQLRRAQDSLQRPFTSV